MRRAASLGFVLLLALALTVPADVPAQTTEGIIVYALQSDVQTWDFPQLRAPREHHPRLLCLRLLD